MRSIVSMIERIIGGRIMLIRTPKKDPSTTKGNITITIP